MTLLFWFAAQAEAGPCEGLPLFTPGSSTTMSHFDKKGKMTGATVATNTGGGAGQAQVHAESRDGKGKLLSTADYTVSCADGAVSIDMRAFLPQDQMQPYGKWDASIEGDHLDFPAAPAAGQKLPDGTVKISLTSPDMPAGSPMSTITIELAIRDRTVGASQSVTTPAGTFDAFPITQTTEIVTTTLAPIRFTVNATDWYAPGAGLVRTETRRNDKLLGTSELTAISK